MAARLDLPWVELDSLHHGPNWNPASATELQARVLATLDDDRGWVVDGNYDSKLGRLIWDRAELIVWLDLPVLRPDKVEVEVEVEVAWRSAKRGIAAIMRCRACTSA